MPGDPDDPNRYFEFYFYSNLTHQTIDGPPTSAPVPEPGPAMLMLTGLLTK